MQNLKPTFQNLTIGHF